MHKVFLICTILIIAFALRIYHLDQRTIFDADQEWLAFRAQDVRNGDVVLLGPTTSVGSFSIGPGYVYLLSFFGLFTNNAPITDAYLSVTLGIITLILVYLFIKNYIDQKTAYVILILAAISSPLIFWDQIPWAPSLFYLSQLILLFGAYLINKKQIGYPVIAVGLAIGFQSHFGIVLSLIAILVYLFIVRPVKPSVLTVLLTMGIFVFGFLPNIIFDITHNFVNFYRLFNVTDLDGVSYSVSFNKIINVLITNTTSLIYPRNDFVIDDIFRKSIAILVFVNALSFLRIKNFRNLTLLLLITSLLPPAIFLFQQGKFSEYYLMMTVPSLILLFALFIYRIINKKIMVVGFILLAIFINYNVFSKRYVSWNLKAKQTIASRIVGIAGTEGYDISLNSKLGDQFGFRYIFKYFNIKANIPPKKGESRIFSVMIPQGYDGMVGRESYDGIGLLWSGI